MTFMSALKTHLENNYPDYITSALYFGYMDMTYFAFTPLVLKDKKLKIAIVFLHEPGRFEVWLGGNNRKIQADYIARLGKENIGKYSLSRVSPGVDSIIESILVEQPDFSDLENLKKTLERKTIEFVNDMLLILQE